MAFKRAEWHSGLTYQQTCSQCRTTIQYKDDCLDFRPWYANGFILCPTCKQVLRHSEEFAINAPKSSKGGAFSDPARSFCAKCGTALRAGDHFCPNCGAKKG